MEVKIDKFESDLIPVLDKGYVKLIDSYGGDLSVARSARASYAKEVGEELTERDAKLIYFLVREKHFSTLRHAFCTFELKVPLMIARQWWKYIIGSEFTDTQVGWNESSRRYVTSDEEFYMVEPNAWRSKPENSKQGSGDPVDELTGAFYSDALAAHYEEGLDLYRKAMDAGIAPEQARLFLPAYGLYVQCQWTCSLQAILHFLSQRLPDDAQWEIQQYAKAVYRLAQPLFPVTFSAAGLT